MTAGRYEVAHDVIGWQHTALSRTDRTERKEKRKRTRKEKGKGLAVACSDARPGNVYLYVERSDKNKYTTNECE